MTAVVTRSLRSCLGRFATGVVVVTFDGPDGRRGITVNAFTAVSMEPPLVLVSVARRARSHDALKNRAFCVNVLGAEQEPIARQFAGTGNGTAVWVDGAPVPRLPASWRTSNAARGGTTTVAITPCSWARSSISTIATARRWVSTRAASPQLTTHSWASRTCFEAQWARGRYGPVPAARAVAARRGGRGCELMPLPDGLQPTKVIAVHLNYRSRAEQRGRVPSEPSYFLKPPSSLSDGGPVERPSGAELLAYEGEIALIVGTRVREATLADAQAAIGWYAQANDFGVHDFRWADRGSNVLSKGHDGYTPIGPGVAADRESGKPRWPSYVSQRGCGPRGRPPTNLLFGSASSLPTCRAS